MERREGSGSEEEEEEEEEEEQEQQPQQQQVSEVLLYHERQRLQLCLLHALNNLFQDKHAFTRGDLNAIAHQLQMDDPHQEKDKWTPLSVIFKPHHNILTGNYDVNVLIAALEGPRNKKVLWHDRRTSAASINLKAPDLMGIMLNTSIPRLRGLWSSRHWVALRNIRSVWYNLDSDLPAPQPFHHETHLISFLDDTVARGGEIFLIFNLE